MERELCQLVIAYGKHRWGEAPIECTVRAPDPWDLDIRFALANGDRYRIRNLRSHDVPLLHEFGDGLGPASKVLFCPYPWHDPGRLEESFQRAIYDVLDRRNASYLWLYSRGPTGTESACTGKDTVCTGNRTVCTGNRTVCTGNDTVCTGNGTVCIGNFGLYGAGGNPASRMVGLEVPVLGLAIADAWQGRGLGGLSVRILQTIARSLAADAIELTTAQFNTAGFRAYSGAGFEQVGLLRITLGIDMPDPSTPGRITRSRDERHMAYIIDAEKREAILSYLEQRRTDALRRHPLE